MFTLTCPCGAELEPNPEHDIRAQIEAQRDFKRDHQPHVEIYERISLAIRHARGGQRMLP
jgi:hypothetical protein